MAAVSTLSDESFWFKEVTWNVSERYTNPNVADHPFASPFFSFAYATWQLTIAPFGLSVLNTVGWINLGVRRVSSEIIEHDVLCKFYFKTRRGKEFQPYQEAWIFNKMGESYHMDYIEKDRYFQNKLALMTNGIFTIVCEMRTRMHNKQVILGKENFSQTELSGPVVGLHSVSFYGQGEKHDQESLPSTSGFKFKDGDINYKLPEAKAGNKVVEDLKKLFLKQEECDVVLKVQGKEFSAHKAILIARSPVFASTFGYDTKEKATGVIDIEDCEPSSFSDFLCFLYCGNIETISTTNVFSLFVTADKYDVQDLRSECMEFMKSNLSVDTFCDTIALALQHSEKVLMDLAIDFLAKNLQETIMTVKWQNFLLENPIQSNELMIKALASNKK